MLPDIDEDYFIGNSEEVKFRGVWESGTSSAFSITVVSVVIVAVLFLLMRLWNSYDMSMSSTCPRKPGKRAGSIRSSSDLYALQNCGRPVTIMYYADFCGHCKLAKPAFDQAAENSNAEMYVCEADPNRQDAILTVTELHEMQVHGFPSVIKYDGDKAISYKGERTSESYKSFAEKPVPT
eukprot:6213505-Pleurochrysis_carterae.AAC.1